MHRSAMYRFLEISPWTQKSHHEGYANEIVKDEVAGLDLLEALLKLMNLIKTKQIYPLVLEKYNITSIHKKKSKRDFEKYWGIF